MSAPEWSRLHAAIEALPSSLREVVLSRVAALRRDASRPIVCPLLDRDAGTCLTYDARPLACRTYGFYVDGADGKHCERVTEAVLAHPSEDVVWGNEPALLDGAARELGPSRTLLEWLRP